MNIPKSTIIWSFVLIILTCFVDVDAGKASRARGGGSSKKTPNYDHVALSYGGSHHRQHQPVQHQQAHQVHQTHTQAHAPSAPALPSSNNNQNKPVGWNVPHSETVNQPKAATHTQSALPYPHNNPPPYQQHAGFNSNPPAAGPPPPYSANPNSGGFNSHPAGPPPPYSQNPNSAFNGQPPAYQPAQSYPGTLFYAPMNLF